ncbi:MAG: cytidylate kinase-like family protein [Chloroflexi bacterium]|nr:cytidylate kinase-like family protein [Chloroflexota bacterium]
MPAITIRGLIGSGAYLVAPEVARIMNVRYVDRQILSEIARHLDTTVEEVADIDHVPWGLRGRIAKELGRAFEQISAGPVAPFDLGPHYVPTGEVLTEEKYISALESVIHDMVETESVVLVSRGAQMILKDHPGSLHVYLQAPMEVRIPRVIDYFHISREDAEKKIEELDKAHKAYIKKYFKAAVEDMEHYDLIINTRKISLREAINMIVSLVGEPEDATKAAKT